MKEVANKKPAPDIFLKAAEQLGVPPAQCVVVEDAVNGVQAARAAGMPCVAVAQSFSAELLRDADAVVPRIADLDVDRLLAIPQAVRATTGSAMPAAVPGAAAEGARWPSARPWGFWATLGLSLAVAAVVLASELGLTVVLASAAVVGNQGEPAPSWVYQQGLLWALATLISTPLLIGLTLLFAWMRRGLSVREYLALRGLRKRTLVRWCLGLLAFAVVSDSSDLAVGQADCARRHDRGLPDLRLAWTSLGAVVVCAPWGEEIFFRGFLFKGWLHSPLGGWGTVLLTSLIWAVIHLQYDLLRRRHHFRRRSPPGLRPAANRIALSAHPDAHADECAGHGADGVLRLIHQPCGRGG